MIMVKYCSKGYVKEIKETVNTAAVLHKVVSPSADGSFAVFFLENTTVLDVLRFGLEVAAQLSVFNVAKETAKI